MARLRPTALQNGRFAQRFRRVAEKVEHGGVRRDAGQSDRDGRVPQEKRLRRKENSPPNPGSRRGGIDASARRPQ